MTNPITPPEGETTPPEEPQAPASPNAEAAKYRRRLRDAEAERDQLAAKVAEFETAEREVALSNARAEHADRIGLPGIADHILGEDPEQITAEADRLATIAATVLDQFHNPENGILAQAAELLEEHEITPDSSDFTLEGAAQLFNRLPSILASDNPGEELIAVLEVARPKKVTGPFVPQYPQGVRRQISGGDLPKNMTVGEAMHSMFN